MPLNIGTEVFENDIFKFYENADGDLIKEHKSTGATFEYNSTEDQWVASDGISTPALEANGSTFKGAFATQADFDATNPDSGDYAIITEKQTIAVE
jgi:hypothetical protein